MKCLHSICLITKDVRKLRLFYEDLLQVAAEGDDSFASFSTIGIMLSIADTRLMEQMAPGSTDSAGNGSCVLELEVDDVDDDYERLRALNVPIVKPPTTQPWGLRSVWFRDPDANIVNFFMRIADR